MPRTDRTTLIIAAVAVVIAAVALIATLGRGGDAPVGLRAATITTHGPSSSFEAVSMSTGDVLFAHVRRAGDGLLLSDIYTVDHNSGRLVRRGAELYAPAGPMLVNPAQVVSVEDVTTGSDIAKAIVAIEAKQAK